MLITSLIGSTILVNGNILKAEDAINSAEAAANAANVHQLATALELYYSDHNAYPETVDGFGMIEELYAKDYIRSKPLDPDVFHYTVKDGGQDYSLTLIEG